jgi:uncharacterized protein YmfQ (DUF2313 family)
MSYTALEVATWARESISVLKPLYDNDSRLFEKLAELSGLSKTHIAAFAREPEYNITVSRLDRLVAALKILLSANCIGSNVEPKVGD